MTSFRNKQIGKLSWWGASSNFCADLCVSQPRT